MFVAILITRVACFVCVISGNNCYVWAALPASGVKFERTTRKIDAEVSAAIAQELRDSDFLDPTTGQLAQDPRRTAWRDVIANVPKAADMPMASDKSSLSEVMNVAWAVHELFHDGVDDMYDFFLHSYPVAISKNDAAAIFNQ